MLTTSVLVGAESGQVSGRIRDGSTLRPVDGVVVRLLEADEERGATASDADGRFLLSDIEPGLYRLRAEAPGFRPSAQQDVRVERGKTAVVDVLLVPLRGASQSIEVRAREPADDPAATVSSVGTDREGLRRSPGTAGDVMRALDSLPGVNSTGQFSSFSVRGRGPRDNLILVDNIPFDKIVHFDQSIGEQEDIGGGGRFSIFAPNLIGSAEFQAGAWGAAYGGKNGSLVRLNVAEGNRVTPSVSGRVDISGWEINYDGPSYFSDNTSLLVSARRLEFERVFEVAEEEDIGAPILQDFILKTATEIGPRHRLNLLAIYSPEEFTRDVENVLASPNFEDASLVRTDQDSGLLGLTWRWLAGESAYFTNTFYYRESDKLSEQGESFPDQAGPDPAPADVPVRERILTLEETETEFGWRGDYHRVIAGAETLTAGLRLTRVELDHSLRLDGDWVRYVYDRNDSRVDPDRQYLVLTPQSVNSTFVTEETRAAGYVEYAFGAGLRWTISPGARVDYDGFSGSVLWSPRLNAGLSIDERTRLSLGAGVFYQNPRFLELALDPANGGLDNERSIQVAAGISRYLRDDLKLGAEVYHQRLDDLVVVPDRTTGQAFNAGDGHSSGIDVWLIKRLTGNWYGQTGYSWSVARRDDRQGDGTYDADFHRPHLFNLGFGYQLGRRWVFSGKWRYASGRPTDAFVVHADVFNDPAFFRFSKEITDENAERLPHFETLNLRVDYRRSFGRVTLIAFVDVFNVYGRDNVDSLEWNERAGENVEEGLDNFPTFGFKFEF